jgi:hypothetical protein
MIIILVEVRGAHIVSAGYVLSNYRIVQAVGEHVIAEQALAGGGVCVGVDESAEAGIVITGLQVIQAGFLIVGVASVAERVEFATDIYI